VAVREIVMMGLVIVLFASCSNGPREEVPAAGKELAPTGRLRAGLNFGNALLTGKDPATGEARGVAADIARELGRRLNVPVDIVAYESAGALADAASSGAWDIGFLGAEPQRASVIDFTAAYAEIESTYLVPPGSSLQDVGEVDREGVRIAIAAKSAYDLYLTRTLKQARLERTDGADAAFAKLVGDKLDAMAGLRPALIGYAERLPGARVLDGRFTSIQQAVGTPVGRGAGAEYLRAFVEDVKASGFVAQAIERNGVNGLTVAPPAGSQ
jgi:polar amino acid transport system substrate-binding protein